MMGDAGREEEDEIHPLSSPPISPSAFKETLIIFDWDDTILPTSWLERIHALTAGVPLRPDVQRQLANLGKIAMETMAMCTHLGTVVFITNSAPGWVDQSCQLFMPSIFQQVHRYPIFAKPMHAPLTFKISTFRKECRPYRNCISVGDGDAERAACIRLQAPQDRKGILGGGDSIDPSRRVKSVKLQEFPTCAQLIAQHEMLQVRLSEVIAAPSSLDLKVRFMGGNGKASTCNLMHFTNRPFERIGAMERSVSLGAATAPVRGTHEDSPKMQGGAGLRSLSRPTSQQQLPPLGGSKRGPSHGEVMDYAAAGSRLLERGGHSVSCSAIPGVGSVAGATEHSEPGEGRPASSLEDHTDKRRGLDRDMVPVRTPLWKVQPGGQAQNGSRSAYHGAGMAKKRPVFGNPYRPSALGGRSGGAVWRENSAPAAPRGF
mmetsp:Transcript_44560/g.83641  ORF Transcript_44560/g.83641 Transcript_44560/m.83641 type:complete len:431 (-) Transcript_44560:105-1397(-)